MVMVAASERPGVGRVKRAGRSSRGCHAGRPPRRSHRNHGRRPAVPAPRTRKGFHRPVRHDSTSTVSLNHAAPAPVSPRRTVALALALLAAVLLAYAGSFPGPFVFDDVPAVAAARQALAPAADPTAAADAAVGEIADAADPGATTAGRPVYLFSLILNAAISGDRPWSYRVVNVALHGASALLLFGVLHRLFRRRGTFPAADAPVWAALAAGLWALHPLQTAAVTYLAQRAESLAALWMLAALYAFLRSGDSATPRRWYAAAVAACFLGVATKETAIVAPVLLLLLDRATGQPSFAAALRTRPGFYAAASSSWLLLAMLVAGTAGRGGTAGFDSGLSAGDYLLTQSHALPLYLRLAFWPHPLVFDYGTPRIVSPGDALLPGTIVLALLAATVVALRRRSPWGWAGAAFFVLLAPSSSVVPIASQTIAEHRMYLAVLVPILAFVFAARRWLGRGAGPLCLAAALAAAGTTFARNVVYRSEADLWRDTAAKRPDNARAHHNLGLVELGRANPAAALAHLETARRLDPGVADVHYNLGLVLARLGRPADAAESHRRALALAPAHVAALRSLAASLLAADRPAEALDPARRAAALRPTDADVHHTLAEVLLRQRDLDAALRHSLEALRLRPSFAAAHFSAGNACAELRRFAEARTHYEAALTLAPDDARVLTNFGNVLAQLGDLPAATARYERALVLEPARLDTRRNLALALLQQGRLAAAEPHLAALVAARPDDAAVADALRRVRAELRGARP